MNCTCKYCDRINQKDSFECKGCGAPLMRISDLPLRIQTAPMYVAAGPRNDIIDTLKLVPW